MGSLISAATKFQDEVGVGSTEKKLPKTAQQILKELQARIAAGRAETKMLPCERMDLSRAKGIQHAV